jgi:hypothetical protein
MVLLELGVPRKLNRIQDVPLYIYIYICVCVCVCVCVMEHLALICVCVCVRACVCVVMAEDKSDDKKLFRISGTGWEENIKILVIFHKDLSVKPCSSGLRSNGVYLRLVSKLLVLKLRE